MLAPQWVAPCGGASIAGAQALPGRKHCRGASIAEAQALPGRKHCRGASIAGAQALRPYISPNKFRNCSNNFSNCYKLDAKSTTEHKDIFISLVFSVSKLVNRAYDLINRNPVSGLPRVIDQVLANQYHVC